MGLGVALAIVLAATSLIVSLVRGDASSAGPEIVKAEASTGDTTDADRALCEAVAPLLRESAESGKRFVNLGQSGTPARDAGIADYRDEVEEWAKRIQPILDKDAGPPRYLTRTLQAFVDYTRLYATSIRPGPATEFDTAAWDNRVVNYGGPLEMCRRLGVEW